MCLKLFKHGVSVDDVLSIIKNSKSVSDLTKTLEKKINVGIPESVKSALEVLDFILGAVGLLSGIIFTGIGDAPFDLASVVINFIIGNVIGAVIAAISLLIPAVSSVVLKAFGTVADVVKKACNITGFGIDKLIKTIISKGDTAIDGVISFINKIGKSDSILIPGWVKKGANKASELLDNGWKGIKETLDDTRKFTDEEKALFKESADKSIHNDSTSNPVGVLGRWDHENGIAKPNSYEEVGKNNGYMFYHTNDEVSENIKKIANGLSKRESRAYWMVNKYALDNMLAKTNKFILTHDPWDPIHKGSQYSMELKHLLEEGYVFVKNEGDDYWSAIKK